MQTKHTAGTWKVVPTLDQNLFIDSDNGVTIANIEAQDDNGIITDEMEANASLIAAAPLLYNAAYSALQAIYCMPKSKQGFFQYLINDLLNAIQKADGIRI